MQDKHLEFIVARAAKNERFKKLAIEEMSKIPDAEEREKRLSELNAMIEEVSSQPPTSDTKNSILHGWVYPFFLLLYIGLGSYGLYKYQINPQIAAVILFSPFIILLAYMRVKSNSDSKGLEAAYKNLKEIEQRAKDNGI